MAFEPQADVSAVSIGNIVIILKDAFDEEGAPYQSANFELQIIMSDGSVKRRAGNLIPHITPAQRQALMDFMSDERAQAESEIIP